MELFGRELTLEQVVGLVECNATPDEDLVHRAALEITAALRESQRRERAAVEDLRLSAVELSEGMGACVVCKHYPDYLGDKCSECVDGECLFEWRGPQEKGE